MTLNNQDLIIALTNFKNAVIGKINSLISTHNASNEAHSDIRQAINSKTDDTALNTHKSDDNAHSSLFATKANSADLATVATSGSYNDLNHKPIIGYSNGNLSVTYYNDL